MHPYLSEQLAAAHVADLRREAAATCCWSMFRRPLRQRLRRRHRAARGCCRD